MGKRVPRHELSFDTDDDLVAQLPEALPSREASSRTSSRTKSWEEGDGAGASAKSRAAADEPIQYKMAATGRHILASPMPRTMSDGLNRLDQRNKALKTLLHKQNEEMDARLGSAAIGATDLLNECQWDMSVAVDAMLQAIHSRDEIDECFTRKGATPVTREAERVKQMNQSLAQLIEVMNHSSSKQGSSMTRPGSAEQFDKGQGSADESESAHRSRMSSVRSAKSVDEKLQFFEYEAADAIRKAAIKQAVLEEQRQRLRYGDMNAPPASEHEDAADARAHDTSQTASFVKRRGKQDRVQSENDMGQWLAQASGLSRAARGGEEEKPWLDSTKEES
jgi:hypothetical protein